MSGETGWTRPWTPDRVESVAPNRTVTTIVMKRCCNGCGRELGDANEVELTAAICGGLLPDVRLECGCWGTSETERLISERDRACAVAVRLEQENAHLLDTLRALRASCEPGAPLLTIDDIAERIDAALEVT